MPHLGPPNNGERPHTGVHRRTLRQILSTRLGGSLRTGAAVVSYVEDVDGVTERSPTGAPPAVTCWSGRTASTRPCGRSACPRST